MSNKFTFETETQKSIMKQDKIMARKQKVTIIIWEHTLSISSTVPTVGWEEAPEHFFRRTAITSPDCQEFMV